VIQLSEGALIRQPVYRVVEQEISVIQDDGLAHVQAHPAVQIGVDECAHQFLVRSAHRRKIAALPTTAVVSVDGDTRILLGPEPIPLPQLFADMLHRHVATRPNLRTAGEVAVSPWLFPGVRPGRHLTAQRIMTRLRTVGINLLGARNTALQSLAVEVPPLSQSLAVEVPPPLVAELLDYSHNVAQRHAEIAAQPWAGYVTSRQPPQAFAPRHTTGALELTVLAPNSRSDSAEFTCTPDGSNARTTLQIRQVRMRRVTGKTRTIRSPNMFRDLERR